jgi:hypothetical protein
MSVSVTSTNVGTPAEKLYGDLVYGAESINKGIMEVIVDKRHKIPLNRFVTASAKVVAPQDEPSTTVNASAKTEVLITTGELELYDEFSPSDFNDDWRFLNSAGPSNDVSFAPAILQAIYPAYTKSFNTDLEQIIWQGNTGGAEPLKRFDGLLKIADADGTVNDLAAAGAITSANIIAILNGMVNTLPAVVKGTTMPFIVMSHTDFWLYSEALTALDYKGTNYNESGFLTFRGFRLVPVSGIPAGRLFFTHDGNIKFATWMPTDFSNVLVNRLAANTRLWFIKITAECGVNYLFGKEIALYATA